MGELIRGKIKEGVIPQLFFYFRKNAISGILHLESGKTIKEFYFINGLLCSSKSNLVSETLGRILLRRNIIDKEMYEKSLEIMKKINRRHGEVLKKLGMNITLEEALKMQIEERAIETFIWKDGEYIIKNTLPDNIGEELKTDVIAIILNGIMDKMDAGYFNSIKSLILERTFRRGDGMDDGNLRLGIKIPNEVKRLSEIGANGKDFLSALNLPEDVGIRVLYFLLITSCLIEIEEESAKKEQLTDNEKSLLLELTTILQKLKNSDYFTILGIPRNSDIATIKNVYFRLADQYHPDRFFGIGVKSIRNVAEEIFTIINEAFYTLKDEVRKKEYIDELEGVKEKDVEGKVIETVNAEIQFQKGEVLDKLGKLKEAIEHYRWAIKLNPKEQEYIGVLGWALYRLGKKTNNEKMTDEGRNLILMAVKTSPNSERLNYVAASLFRAEGNLAEYEKYLQNTLAINPKNIEVTKELRLVKYKKERG